MPPIIIVQTNCNPGGVLSSIVFKIFNQGAILFLSRKCSNIVIAIIAYCFIGIWIKAACQVEAGQRIRCWLCGIASKCKSKRSNQCTNKTYI